MKQQTTNIQKFNYFKIFFNKYGFSKSIKKLFVLFSLLLLLVVLVVIRVILVQL
jgi:hypothetical protein